MIARTAPVLAVLLSLAASSPASAEPLRERVKVLPGCPGILCPDGKVAASHTAKGKRTFYLVFDGITLTSSDSADDATDNKSVILFLGGTSPGQTEQIPAFQTNQLSDTDGLSRDQIIAQVIDQLEAMYADIDVEFTTTRPSSGIYEMIVFGGSCQSVLGEAGCGGVALADCGNTAEKNITFVFPVGLHWRDLAPTAAQESAHAFGLAHTVDDTEVMYPFIQPGFYPDHFGDTNAACPSDEVQQGATCGKTSQNSYQDMLSIIGPKGQDVYGPDISITSHVDGGTIRAGDRVTAQIIDEQSGVSSAALEVNGVMIETKSSGPYEFTFPDGVAPGNASVVVQATDAMNNRSSARVTLYVPSGDETPCEGDDDCADGLECNGEFCVPDNGVSELGEACTDGAQCDTMLCGEVDGEQRCTRQCTDTTPCPDGFECRGDGTGACWPADEGGGCGCRSTGLSGLPGVLVLLGAALLGLRRRRAAA